MAPLTAAAALLGGLALWLGLAGGRGRTACSRAGAILVGVAAAYRLGLYWTNQRTSFDLLWFAPDAARAPALMAPLTALGFLFLGLALAFLPSRKWGPVAPSCALTVALVGFLGFGGILYGGRPLLFARGMAPHSCLALLSLGLGALLARPSQLPMALILGDTPGGATCRRLLPAAIVLPFVLGWLGLRGQRSGWYGTEGGLGLLSIAYLLAFGALIWIAARAADRVETRRRREGGQLREAREQLAAIVESSDDAIIGKRLDGTIVSWNRGAERIFGYPAGEIVGRNITELIPPDRPDEESEIVARIGRGETVEHYETVRRRRDGSLIDISATISPIRDASGRIVGASKIARDITAGRKAAEALRASEERFRQMAENIGEVFWMTDPGNNEMIYVSPAFERIWGRPCAELRREPRTWSRAIVPDDRARVEEAASAGRATGAYDVEYRITRPDGAVRWIRDRAFPIRTPGGAVYRVVGIATDLTERKKLEEQFLHAQRMEAIGTLAAGVAHDLNNILSPMLMAAGLLKERTKEPRDRHILDLVESGAQRGAGVVRQLLTFSRGLGGERLTVQLRHLLREVSDLMHETFPKNIAIDREIAGDLSPVRADPTQIHQVLMNLCVNARDAMPGGGRLVLAARNWAATEDDLRGEPQAKAGPWVLISVTDSGHGIPPEIIKRIFDPFFTTKGVGKGTGLGLSTVLGIVRNHGGFVRVRSEPGQGASFQIHLPAESAAPQAESPQAAGAQPRGRGEVILVVDDEAPIREAARYALEARGYRVVSAANGEEAITRFLEHRQDIRLVLTDIMMPVMDGPTLVRSLRVLNPALRFIGTSGLDQLERRAEFSALGISEFLAKPYEAGSLLDAVRRQLEPA